MASGDSPVLSPKADGWSSTVERARARVDPTGWGLFEHLTARFPYRPLGSLTLGLHVRHDAG